MRQATTYIEALDKAIVDRRKKEASRGHLGWSRIGIEDERLLWLEFRWCLPSISDPRILRIFDFGNAIERLAEWWTRSIPGVKLETTAPDGAQFRFERLGGHLAGSMDGAVRGLPEDPDKWMVWEVKSANDNRFKAMLKETGETGMEDLLESGLQRWAPAYYAQVIGYMGETGMSKAVVVIVCKNTSKVHAEYIEANPMEFQTYVSKAERLITAEEPPESPYPGPTDWRSRRSLSEAAAKVYWREELPGRVHCRNCRFSKPDMDGEGGYWRCHYHESKPLLDLEAQRKGCEWHQFIPALVPATFINATDDHVQYESDDGVHFFNGNEPDTKTFSSKELVPLSRDGFAMLSDQFFMEARKEFDARVVFDPDEDVPF